MKFSQLNDVLIKKMFMHCFDNSNYREYAGVIDRCLDEIEKPEHEKFRTTVIQLGKMSQVYTQAMQDYSSLAIVSMAVNTSISTLGTTPSGLLKMAFEAYNQYLPSESRIPLVNSYITIIHIIQKILSMGGRDKYITTRIVDEILESEDRLKYPSKDSHATRLFEAFENVHLEAMLQTFGFVIRGANQVSKNIISATALVACIEQLSTTNIACTDFREAFTLVDDITLTCFLLPLISTLPLDLDKIPCLLNFVKAILREGGLSTFIQNHTFHAKNFSEELASIPNFNSEALNEDDKAIYNNLIDPITLSLINDPITAQNGQTYDRVSLAQYFKSQGYPQILSCPTTRLPIHFGLLTSETNVVLKNTISHFVGVQKNKAHQQRAADTVSTSPEVLGSSSSQLYQMPRNTSEVKRVKFSL